MQINNSVNTKSNMLYRNEKRTNSVNSNFDLKTAHNFKGNCKRRNKGSNDWRTGTIRHLDDGSTVYITDSDTSIKTMFDESLVVVMRIKCDIIKWTSNNFI